MKIRKAKREKRFALIKKIDAELAASFACVASYEEDEKDLRKQLSFLMLAETNAQRA